MRVCVWMYVRVFVCVRARVYERERERDTGMKHVCSYVVCYVCMHGMCVCVCSNRALRTTLLCVLCVYECVMYVKPVLCARVADMHVVVVSP